MKFLQTFASQSGAVKAVNKGPNDLIPLIVEYEVTSALTDTQTCDLTLPAGYEDYVPHTVSAHTNGVTRTQGAISITNHNRSTGVTRLTAGTAGVADNSTIVVTYVPATIGT